MSIFPAYILVSHGPKHVANIEDSPGAASQFKLLSDHSETVGASLHVLGHDYARKIHSVDDLSNLFRLLALHRERSQGGPPMRLRIDDYTRLFRAATDQFKPVLWRELMHYSDHLIDLRQGKPLHCLSKEMALMIQTGMLSQARSKPHTEARSKSNKSRQTNKARWVSAMARKKSAERSAIALREALTNVQTSQPKTSMAEFLASEHAVGLCNSLGKPWTYRSALRAIRRLEAA